MNKIVLRRSIAFYIFISLLISTIVMIFSSCAEGAEEPAATPETTADEQETEAETRAVADLPETDFEGRAFRIFGRENTTYNQFSNFEFFAESEDGEVVNDAVYARNRIIEEKYNVKTEQTLLDDTTGHLRKTVTSAEDIYDVAALHHFTNVSSLAVGGYLSDLNQINHIDFTKPWWSLDVNAALSFAGKLYYTTSDYLLLDKQRTYILIFNKKIAEDYALGNLYQTVFDGKWTADAMLAMTGKVSSDIDGDGKMTDIDMYGLGMDSYLSFYTFYIAMGGTIVGRDENDLPVLTMNDDRNISAIDKVIDLTCNTDTALFCDDFQGKVDYDYWSVMGKTFYAGRELFMSAFPHSLKSISANTDVDFDYGVLPFPKNDQSQEKYLTIPDNYHSMVLTIPITNTDTDFAGFMLEALSAESRYTTLPAYYEVSCKTKYTYDEESARCLDIVFGGITYDLGSIYDWGTISNLLKNTIPSKKENVFASEYAKREPKALTDMQKTIDEFLSAGE
ncbi:MAG: hypothetical protein PHZ09_04415 [Eubacteriales bacterium]|nr:hypothetical protein [Eubacteriales bacterium]